MVTIRKTAFHASFRTGRQECWEAVTTDGAWLFVRQESAGTPWLVFRAGEDAPRAMCGTLRGCRTWAAQ